VTADRGTRQPGTAPTIYDVARECGVAPSTVSRAFSRPGRVNARTAERIRAAAERIGYRANPLVQAATAAKTSMIALVVSDVTNPVYFALIRGAEAAAAEAGYTMMLADTQESRRTERAAIERVLPAVDGLLLAGSRMSDSAIRTLAQQVPMVVANRAVAGVSSVVTDNARGIRRALEHLGELGHTAVVYVAGPEASWADGTRWRAAVEGSIELSMHVRRLGPYPPTVRGGLAAAGDLIGIPATAALCYNDLIAIGVLRGLAPAGIGVPADISVVGFDNIFGSDFCTPALTTVASPLQAMGTTAVQQLIAQARGAAARTGTPATLPARLVVRASTGHRSPHRTSAHPWLPT
jgi:LacI family transcriptional regulator, repressor for deo operon, udp, cdd, tsx, nupC, and nupG